MTRVSWLDNGILLVVIVLLIPLLVRLAESAIEALSR